MEEKRRRVWISREASGLYMMTRFQPEVHRVKGTRPEILNLYFVKGESIGVRHLCPNGIKAIFGIELKSLESKRCWLTAGVEVDKDECNT